MNKVNYYIEDNFLTEQQCSQLIKESEKNTDISDFIADLVTSRARALFKIASNMTAKATPIASA